MLCLFSVPRFTFFSTIRGYGHPCLYISSIENIVPLPLLRQRATYLCSHLSQVLCSCFSPQPSGQFLVSRKQSGLLWCQEEELRVSRVTLGLGSWVQSFSYCVGKEFNIEKSPPCCSVGTGLGCQPLMLRGTAQSRTSGQTFPRGPAPQILTDDLCLLFFSLSGGSRR